MVKVKYRDAISGLLDGFVNELSVSTAKGRGNFKEHLRGVGETMVRYVRTSMLEQKGVADGVAYAPLSEKYKKYKVEKLNGPGDRVLYLRGRLAGSWRITRLSKDSIVVGAGGGKINAEKAAGHSGGLAQKYGRPELDRLRIGFSPKLADTVNRQLWDAILAAVARKAPKKGR